MRILGTYKLIVVVGIAGIVSAAIITIPKISMENRLLIAAEKNISQRKFREALDDYERAVRYSPKSAEGLFAAEKGGETALFQAKDFQRAVFFFRSMVLNSNEPSNVRGAQQRIAEIYYDKINDYSQAILEYQRLLNGKLSSIETQGVRLRIAKAYFYLANFEQAIFEAQEFLKNFPSSGKGFEAQMLIGNSYLALRQHDRAIQVFEHIEKYYPDYPESYQASLNKALAFEEKEDFGKAVASLESIRHKYPQPDVLDLKIKAIEKRSHRRKR